VNIETLTPRSNAKRSISALARKGYNPNIVRVVFPEN